MLKRGLGSCFVLLLVVALVVPAAASTKRKIYHLDGTVEGGGTMAFDAVVKKKKGKKAVPKRVANFEFDNLPVTCDSGSFTFSASSGTDRPPFPVQDGQFSFEFVNSPTSVEGQLRKKGKRAAGQFERGPAPLDGETNCFTPELSWSAQKTGTHQTLPRL